MRLNKKLISAILLLAALVLAAYIANRVPGQIDATAEGVYTLSEASRSIARGLEEPVELTFHFSRSLEGLPIRLKNYATRVEDLLRQYERAAGGNIRLRVVDPRPDTDEETAAIRAGLNGQALVDGSRLFFGLQAVQADAVAVIPLFSFDREPFLEYDISQLIHQVQQLDKPVVGLISGLPVQGEGGEPPMPPGQPQPGRWMFLDELERLYTVQHLDDEETPLPGSLDLLLLIHPQELGEERLRQVDQVLLGGTPVLALVDPSSYWQRTSQPEQQMMMGMPPPDTASDLAPIFEANGIRFARDTLAADPGLATLISVQQGAPQFRYPVWLTLRQPGGGNPVTANLNELLFAETGFIEREAGSELSMTPLLATSASAGTIGTGEARFMPPDRVGNALTGERGERVLAAIFEGRFKSAYAEDEAAGGDGILMVVADTDFIADPFAVRVMNLFGMRSATPINDNLAFFFNAVDSLTGSPELVSLRGKGSATRPFTVVEEMQQRAQEEYQEQLAQLEQRLMDVQRELRQLQQRQPDQQELLGSPETREAIERFRLEEAQVRAEQRNIRKKLREDVEALNLRLALINLLAVPLLVSSAGIVYFWKFHRT
jgi:ABC-type uncharacterized transport system involved in gliding motility auxiliary subunit